MTHKHYLHRYMCILSVYLYLYLYLFISLFAFVFVFVDFLQALSAPRYMYILCVIVDIRRRHYRRNLKDFSPLPDKTAQAHCCT